MASDHQFEMKGYKFEAEKEQLRPERRVRIGLVQNSIVKSTSDLIESQRSAIHSKIEKITLAASLAGVNIICFQEAWSEFRMP